MKRIRLTEKTAADKKKQDVVGRETTGFSYDTSKAKVLKRCLHNLNVSLGTMISAMKDIALIRGSEITPDGKLGGRGFIMPFKDIKMLLTEAISNLSDITDTIADELTNPQWKLSKDEIKSVKKEKEKIEEKADNVVEDVKSEKKEIEEESLIEPKDNEIIEKNKNIEEIESYSNISPKDVKDSTYVESLKRYKKLLSGSTDETNVFLGKSILANLLRGDK